MSRKDYEALANIIKTTGEKFPHSKKALGVMVRNFGVYAKKDNPAFDFNRFCVACALGGEK